MAGRVVGVSVARSDAVDKAMGSARYANDISLPHMLFGRILGSPHAHARIVRIDTSRAQRVAGVRAVITGSDFGPDLMGSFVRDMPAMAQGTARFFGEPVAAVAAGSIEAAEEALALVDVEYEELPPILDPVAAMEPGSALVHQDWMGYSRSADLSADRNIVSRTGLAWGDLARGFAEADEIFEDRFTTQLAHQAYTEPTACLADWEGPDRVHLWSTTKTIFGYQTQIAQALGMAPHSVRVTGTRVGGAFGGKGLVVLEPIAAALAKRAGRPVKMVLTRAEEFAITRPRHPSVITMRTGVKRDGTLVAREARLVFDTGAYALLGPSTVSGGSFWACGPYRIPNLRIDGFCVYTNNSVAGAFRGYGAPQGTFAGESQLDLIALRLGIDPVEIRLRNLLGDDDPTPNGEVIEPAILRRCLETAAERIGWREPTRPGRGKGIAIIVKHSGSLSASAEVRLMEDGSAILMVGAVDVGQGSDTVLRQIAAEELGLTFESVLTAGPDTDSSPWDWNTAASRVTHTVGLAVQAASRDAREQLVRIAADGLGADPADITVVGGSIYVRGADAPAATVSSVVRGAHWRQGGPVLGRGSVFTQEVEHASLDMSGFGGNGKHKLSAGVQAVEVSVDADTGRVTCERVVSVHDVGRIINPQAVEGQIEGAVAQGLGYALGEEILREDGRISSALLNDYRVPLAPDMPVIETVILEVADVDGPFGAKGVGEHAVIGIAPAIAGAVEQAAGVRVRDLPITPDKIVAARAAIEGAG
jgi:CO/xanthine dehydrogenase Mo-binding subunit